ncbi:hypothetical protein GGF44_003535, partial [Coemansia sp. RSA 1694]
VAAAFAKAAAVTKATVRHSAAGNTKPAITPTPEATAAYASAVISASEAANDARLAGNIVNELAHRADWARESATAAASTYVEAVKLGAWAATCSPPLASDDAASVQAAVDTAIKHWTSVKWAYIAIESAYSEALAKSCSALDAAKHAADALRDSSPANALSVRAIATKAAADNKAALSACIGLEMVAYDHATAAAKGTKRASRALASAKATAVAQYNAAVAAEAGIHC